MLRKSQSLVPEKPRPVGPDPRLARVGWDLWKEDEAGMLAAIREVGAWPERGILVENLTGERLRCTVALFVQVVRSKGWPKDPGGLFVWCERQGMGVRGPAWHEERKRRDAKVRPGLEAVQGFGQALKQVGVDASAFSLPPEPLPPDFNTQMNELDRMKGKG